LPRLVGLPVEAAVEQLDAAPQCHLSRSQPSQSRRHTRPSPGVPTIAGMAEPVAEYSRVNLSSDPVYRYVRVTKSGAVPGACAEQDVIDHPWLQRLRRIHQMQSAWWVFATAEHSRFQHSMGAMHLAGEWGRHLYPTLRQQRPDAPSQAAVV